MVRRKGQRGYIPLTLLVLLALVLPGLAAGASVAAQAPDGKPNVVLILLDDLRAEDLRRMPNVRRFLVEQGTSFDRAYVTDPICCPSRASILRGQYVHNHGVRTIAGAFQTFRRSGERSTMATWLNDVGYRTALIGKYFVTYPQGARATYVPPGWDGWVADAGGSYFGYDLSANGRVVSYGDGASAYRTDVEGRYARTFLGGASDGKPFFLYFAPKAPHGPATPAPRHRRAVVVPQAPRVPSFNEADVVDKPAYVRRLPRFDGHRVRELDAWHIARQRTLLAADEVIGSLIGTLQQTGELKNTYVILTSDNGYLLGEHRIEGKNVPYEASIRVPLVVRGPGVAAGRTDDRLVSLADLAPTIADLAGAAAPDVDGRSLRPVLEGGDPPRRSAVLVEYVDEHGVGPGGRMVARRYVLPPSWSAVRTADRLYVEYAGGDRELYDTATDPHQLTNLAKNPNAKSQTEMTALRDRLVALKACKGEGCRTAEQAPIVVPDAPSGDEPAAARAAGAENRRAEAAPSGAEGRDARAADGDQSRRDPAREERPVDGRGGGGRSANEASDGGRSDDRRPASRRPPSDPEREGRPSPSPPRRSE